MTNILEVKKLYTIACLQPSSEIDSEICCDLCMEITNNYINECPICKTKNASIDESGSLNENKIEIIQCEECLTYFKKVDGNWYGDLTEEDLLEYPNSYNYLLPKVIVVDAPKSIEIPPKIDRQIEIANQKRIKAMKNFRLFEPLK